MIRPVAYVTDLTGFCDMVKKERGIPDDRMMARISMDYGRGSFKVVVSLFDKDQTADGFAAGETKGRRYTGLLNMYIQQVNCSYIARKLHYSKF